MIYFMESYFKIALRNLLSLIIGHHFYKSFLLDLMSGTVTCRMYNLKCCLCFFYHLSSVVMHLICDLLSSLLKIVIILNHSLGHFFNLLMTLFGTRV